MPFYNVYLVVMHTQRSIHAQQFQQSRRLMNSREPELSDPCNSCIGQHTCGGLR